MSERDVQTSYSARAAEYVSAFGRVEHMHRDDLELLRTWAAHVRGPVLDVGCGPGVLTGILSRLGADVSGVDLVPEFVDYARKLNPGVQFRVGALSTLTLAPAALGGILAWYSLIHMPPAELGTALDTLHEALAPGGSLLVGFFEGEPFGPFPHKVLTAYQWPVGQMAALLESRGFVEQDRRTRTEPGRRPQGVIMATRAR